MIGIFSPKIETSRLRCDVQTVEKKLQVLSRLGHP